MKDCMLENFFNILMVVIGEIGDPFFNSTKPPEILGCVKIAKMDNFIGNS